MTVWPENVLDEIQVSLAARMPDYTLMRRGLRPQDPPQSISLRAGGWEPDLKSWEIPSLEPTVNRYAYEIELLVKHANEATGRSLYTDGAKMVRAVLYRDTDLLVRLRALNEDLLGSTERFKRLTVINQKFLNNNLKSAWYFVATTRFMVETETIVS